MDIASAKEQIKDTVEAYLQKDDAGMYLIDPVHQRPLFVVGAPGIGKTAIMEQIARELGIGLVSYSMTHHTRQSALGLPRIEHRSFEGVEFDASEYTMSEIIASVYDYEERTDLRRGILFLDEINCVSETLYPSMLQFLQFKTFGKHAVPDGWVIVCAGNPPEYNRSVHEFDIVTLDRVREIDVEPDYGVWKAYATARGLHPAVTTFLEAKQDCFYRVESKPGGGKSFVTARGWEDLAQVIALYERLGKPVNRDLMAQFLRDERIADAFSVYYALFNKYRSDYQVDAIVRGEASEAIENRAREAAFDERIALIGLILDAIARRCAMALDQEGVVLELRDVLRAAKPELLDGATVHAAVLQRVAERERALERRVASRAVAKAYVRKERLVIDLLRGIAAQCTLEQAAAGPEAFSVVERAYRDEVAKVEPLAAAASEAMDHAFAFFDACLGSREMLVFVAELTTRRDTTQFIAHYGNEAYYAHNDELKVDAARSGLADRVRELAEMGERATAGERAHAVDTGGAVGLRGGASAPAGTGTIVEVSPAAGVSTAGAPAPSPEALAAYYGDKRFEYGFSSICKMNLPSELLVGKRVLDVCCRRGRGVYKLSAQVGERGFVMGIDWDPGYIEEASAGIDHALRKSGLSRRNMEFRVAYPEDLIGTGIGSATMDAVYVNNVMTLFLNQACALAEFGRVLKPGGLLIMETVFADAPRSEAVVEQARALGNSVQAARTEQENEAWLAAAGFDASEVVDSYEVSAERGVTADTTVPTAPGDERVRYRAVTLHARKR